MVDAVLHEVRLLLEVEVSIDDLTFLVDGLFGQPAVLLLHESDLLDYAVIFFVDHLLVAFADFQLVYLFG